MSAYIEALNKNNFYCSEIDLILDDKVTSSDVARSNLIFFAK